jgi:hypothetical protein
MRAMGRLQPDRRPPSAGKESLRRNVGFVDARDLVHLGVADAQRLLCDAGSLRIAAPALKWGMGSQSFRASRGSGLATALSSGYAADLPKGFTADRHYHNLARIRIAPGESLDVGPLVTTSSVPGPFQSAMMAFAPAVRALR